MKHIDLLDELFDAVSLSFDLLSDCGLPTDEELSEGTFMCYDKTVKVFVPRNGIKVNDGCSDMLETYVGEEYE